MANNRPSQITMTVYELTYGAAGYRAEEKRYFSPTYHNDAFTRAADLIGEFDREPTVWAAYVTLKRLPDGINDKPQFLIGWTKTSDERATFEGEPVNPMEAPCGN